MAAHLGRWVKRMMRACWMRKLRTANSSDAHASTAMLTCRAAHNCLANHREMTGNIPGNISK
eukprot:1183448-Prorocentrum_minimum.AAC.1